MARGVIDTSRTRKYKSGRLRFKLAALKLKGMMRPLTPEEEKQRQEYARRLHWLEKMDSCWIKF